MRSPQLADPAICHIGFFLLRIIVPVSSAAINSSVALKRPERSFGGTTDSRASSFIEESSHYEKRKNNTAVGIILLDW